MNIIIEFLLTIFFLFVVIIGIYFKFFLYRKFNLPKYLNSKIKKNEKKYSYSRKK